MLTAEISVFLSSWGGEIPDVILGFEATVRCAFALDVFEEREPCTSHVMFLYGREKKPQHVSKASSDLALDKTQTREIFLTISSSDYIFSFQLC